MCSYNSITIIGTVIKKPEIIIKTPLTVKLKIETSDVYFSKNKNTIVSTSEVHLVKVWKQNARFAADYLNIGDRVLIEGKLRYFVFENQVDDLNMIDTRESVRIPEILANSLKLMDRKRKKFSREEENGERTTGDNRGTDEITIEDNPDIQQEQSE